MGFPGKKNIAHLQEQDIPVGTGISELAEKVQVVILVVTLRWAGKSHQSFQYGAHFTPPGKKLL